VDRIRPGNGRLPGRGNLRRVRVPGGADDNHAVEGAAMTVVDYELPLKIGALISAMILISFLASIIFGRKRDD